MANSKKLSIIIVSYNSKKNLQHCIESIYAKFGDDLAWEIIVVNNDKKENLVDLKTDFNKVKIINPQENIGFCAGINLGAKKAQGEILLLLNPDTKILSKNVKKLLREFSKNEKLKIIGAGIVDSKNKIQKWIAGKELSLFHLVMNNLGFSRSKKIWNSSKMIKCDWVAGTAFFVEKKIFEQLGGFNEQFFMYF